MKVHKRILPLHSMSMLHTDKDQIGTKNRHKRLILTPPHIFLTLSCSTNWSDIIQRVGRDDTSNLSSIYVTPYNESNCSADHCDLTNIPELMDGSDSDNDDV